MASIIQTRQLTRRFGKTTALHPLTLDIEAGRTVGLVGDNGAGKSTLLRLLAGLLRPTNGSITVSGHEPLSRRGRVAYIPANRMLHPGSKVKQLLRLARAVSQDWDEQQAHALLERFEVSLDARIKALCSNALGSLHLLMAVASRPQVLLIDDLTEGLSPSGAHHVLSLLRELAARRTVTTIIVSNSLADLDGLCSELIVLRQGRLVDCCETSSLKSRFARLTVHFDGPAPVPPPVSSIAALNIDHHPDHWSILTDDIDVTRGRLSQESHESAVPLADAVLQLLRS